MRSKLLSKNSVRLCSEICLLLCSMNGYSQDSLLSKSQQDSIKREMDSTFDDAGFFRANSYWLASLNYMSNNIYLGRKDSVASPYLTATVGYYHKTGLFVSASASYLIEPGQERIDLSTIDGGYSLFSGNFEGSIILSKYFFSSQSYNVRSEIEGSANLSTSYEFGIVRPTLQGTLNFGSRNDYGLGLGLEHTYHLFNKRLTIIPGMMMNASTENYYNDYYEFRRYSLKRLRILQRVLGEISVSAFVENPGAFKILDYEMIIPLTYSMKKFMLGLTPTFTIPLNPAVVDRTTTTKLGSKTKQIAKEKIDNSFFVLASISYSF
ncbi:MAG TPA: hypothetical protein VKR32_03795 [Puia sp.]|nr:hypothetical protein [Puia sp.]